MEKISILLVDDLKVSHTLIQKQILDVFPRASIVHASDGNVAFNKMCMQKFDILLTDIKMPKMSGDKLIASLDQLPLNHKPTGIIAFSADEKNKDTLPLIPKLIFLKKPFDTDELKESIDSLLGASKARSNDKIDVNFINPFIEATIMVLETTCFLSAEKKSVVIKDKKETSGDASALIAMNCSSFKGSMAISFKEDCYLKVVGSMLGEELLEITSDIHDAVGELCNQIFGQAKKRLNSIGYDILPAIPSIIIGRDHIVKHLFDGPCISILFETEFGNFSIETIVSTN